MTTQTQKISSFQIQSPKQASFPLLRIAEVLLAIDLREKFARTTSGAQADAAYAYGL